MAKAYVLVGVAPNLEREVYKRIGQVKEVEEVQPLFGEYDIILKIEASDFDTIGKVVIDKIRSIRGVVDTKTLTVIEF